MVLTILEVSQKQAYIFSSNKLADNVRNSAAIAFITGPEFFKYVSGDKGIYSDEENYVYAGGGHTVLQFDNMDKACAFNEAVTFQIHQDFPDIEIFTSNLEYNETLSPAKNLSLLTEKLERKKAIRRSAFHQGTFGIESIDRNTLKARRIGGRSHFDFMEKEKELSKALLPEGWDVSDKFEDLVISGNGHSFISIIHIDGNGMGARVTDFYNKNDGLSWNEFRKKISSFSEGIDRDFKAALKNTYEEIAGTFLKTEEGKKHYFPIRRIISSGDDICLACDGGIGIETAVRFMRNLHKLNNQADEKKYDSCAGVAIVPQKFPFFRAYEMAEGLCSSAKRFGAGLSKKDNGTSVSSIDWHIEFGEPADTIEEIRRLYKTADGRQLELRPYIVSAPDDILKAEPTRQYTKFLKEIELIKHKDSYARGKIKRIRGALKEGKEATEYYLDSNLLDDFRTEVVMGIYKESNLENAFSGNTSDRKFFIETADGVERSVIFDAIEIMDVFVLEKE